MMDSDAMCLTDGEWTDLAHVCNHFLYATAWADNPAEHAGFSHRLGIRRALTQECLGRRRAVAKRVVAADSGLDDTQKP